MKFMQRIIIAASLGAYSLASMALTCTSNLPAANPDAAYADHGDGTVTHTPTGLMWKRCSEGQTWTGSTCSGTAATYTWEQALSQAANSTYAGRDDWRLPNIKELRSLVEECATYPAINTGIFPSTPLLYFWSSSPIAADSKSAWYVHFYSGSVNGTGRDASHGARLVRAGQSFDNLGVAGTPATVKYVTENLPDGSLQVGAATKTWTFANGATAITGLKAVPVAGKTATGLGITATEVVVGDVAANANFTVSLPVVPEHAGAAVKASYWKLVDASGADVKITNSKTGQFWLKLRTNTRPVFLPTQLDSVGAKVDEIVSIPLLTRDGDGDALTVTASAGSVANGVWSGSFSTAGIKTVTITASDGIESATKNVYVVVRDEAGTARSFSDLAPDSTATACDPANNPTGPGLAADYANGEFLYLHGIVLGVADGNSRRFEPCRYATQAEALKIVMEAARVRGLVTFDEPPRVLRNLLIENPAQGQFVNASWATPYVLKAETLGIVADAGSFDPQAPAKRRFVADAVAALLGLTIPDIPLATPPTFTDEAAFANAADLTAAHGMAFFGLMGSFGQAFDPDAAMIRADVARVATRILRRPMLTDAQLQGSTTASFGGASLPAVGEGQSLKLKGLTGLAGLKPLVSGDTVKDEWIDSPDQWIRVTAYTPAGAANTTPVMAKDLASAPIALPPVPGGQTKNSVQPLTLLLEDSGSGVKSAYTFRYGVLFPDRDGDGIRDDLDAWPDAALFSKDANGNGIPDNVDAAYGIASRKGTDAVTVNGTPTTIVQAVLAGSFAGLAEALTTTTTTSTTSTSSTTVTSTTSTTLPAASISLVQGWNLVGNGTEAAIDVAAAFGDTAKVTTVWKWIAPIARWAFYAPTLGSQALADYAAGKGYEVLNTVAGGEGFWVNAKTGFSVPLPAGATVASSSFRAGNVHPLPRGWNLIATGDSPAPGAFDCAIGPTACTAAGAWPTNLTTLWAWDAGRAGWYFWAPSLVNSNGLAAYLANKGYLDFSTLPTTPPGSLSPATGFWVNVP